MLVTKKFLIVKFQDRYAPCRRSYFAARMNKIKGVFQLVIRYKKYISRFLTKLFLCKTSLQTKYRTLYIFVRTLFSFFPYTVFDIIPQFTITRRCKKSKRIEHILLTVSNYHVYDYICHLSISEKLVHKILVIAYQFFFINSGDKYVHVSSKNVSSHYSQ